MALSTRCTTSSAEALYDPELATASPPLSSSSVSFRVLWLDLSVRLRRFSHHPPLSILSQSTSRRPAPSTTVARPRASSPLGLWTSLLLLSPSLRVLSFELLGSSTFGKGHSQPLSAFLFCLHMFFDTLSTNIVVVSRLRCCRSCCATRATFIVPILTHVGSRPSFSTSGKSYRGTCDSADTRTGTSSNAVCFLFCFDQVFGDAGDVAPKQQGNITSTRASMTAKAR